jgi:hypothetical protein
MDRTLAANPLTKNAPYKGDTLETALPDGGAPVDVDNAAL